jgi:hypothetical protein
MMYKYYIMIRTQIQLSEEDYNKLRAIGARDDKGLAEQVREAVGLYLSGAARRTGGSLDDLAGGFHQLPAAAMDELKPHDRWLADSIRDSKRI